MEINEDYFEKKIMDYQTIIKNPRKLNLFRNFAIIQNNIKIKQLNKLDNKLLINKYEDKLIFVMYLLFKFPEIGEKIRKFPYKRKELIELCKSVPKLNYSNLGFISEDYFNNNIKILFDTKIEESSNKDEKINQVTLTENEKEFSEFIKRFFIDSPKSDGELELFITNNILTSKNKILVESAFSSYVDDKYHELNENWFEFFRVLEEVLIEDSKNNKNQTLVKKIFLNSTINFKDKKLMIQFRNELSLLLNRLIQNDELLQKITKCIIFDEYQDNKTSYFLYHKNKLFNESFDIKSGCQWFIDIFNYLNHHNAEIANISSDYNSYSLLVSTCTYNSSILKLFYVPASVQRYILEQKITKDNIIYNSKNQYKFQEEITEYNAYLILLKFFIYSEESDKLIETKNSQLKALNLYKNQINTSESEIGDIIRQITQNITNKMEPQFLNPVKESLETLFLIIYLKSVRSNEILSTISKEEAYYIPKVVFNLIYEYYYGNYDLSTTEKIYENLKNIIFFDKNLDDKVKKTLECENKKNLNIAVLVKKSCEYLFKKVEEPVDTITGHILNGFNDNNQKTMILFGEMSKVENSTRVLEYFLNIKLPNNEEMLILLISDGHSDEKIKKEFEDMKKLSNKKLIIINPENIN